MYGETSGQLLGLEKFRFYKGSASARRISELRDFLGFPVGSLFSYVGVPLFKGKPKYRQLQPLVDRIKLKLFNWKGSLLSTTGRVQLVKSVIHGMLAHIFIFSLGLLLC